jgi:hypothetical protein
MRQRYAPRSTFTAPVTVTAPRHDDARGYQR